MKIYPLKFRPLFKERIWGGRKLFEFFGKGLPGDVKIGESWELADLPDDKTLIVNGGFAGKPLEDAIDYFGPLITGDPSYEGPFPLLIKILDAQDVLSVQVHPDEETCKRTDKGDPKTECWYIIDAEAGACIYKGLKNGVTREEFAAAIEAGTCAELLEKVEVKVGQCHFLPSGTAHAIGAGLLIAEIQQPSDTTYRVFDWNRVGDDGKPRQLHVEDALESIHFDPSGDDLSMRSVGRLVDTDVFTVDKGHQLANCEVLLSEGKMKVYIFLSGGGAISCNDVEAVEFVKGDAILVPAAFEGVMSFSQECEYLIASV